MSTNTAKQLPPYLSLAANAAWYWERKRRPETVKDFAFDVYHEHPQDIDGLTHREENAVYHIFDAKGYHTLPQDAPKLTR